MKRRPLCACVAVRVSEGISGIAKIPWPWPWSTTHTHTLSHSSLSTSPSLSLSLLSLRLHRFIFTKSVSISVKVLSFTYNPFPREVCVCVCEIESACCVLFASFCHCWSCVTSSTTWEHNTLVACKHILFGKVNEQKVLRFCHKLL